MPLAHLKVQIFQRSKGHSAVSKAAYRAGEALHDQRLGLTWNYSRKHHVDDKFILAPAGAPSWVYDREQLWNTVEQSSRRADSQLARELEISLPRELTRDQQRELLETFIHEHFVSRGMVADCAIHRPPPKPGVAATGEMGDDHNHNPHAHVMLTMRNLTQTGFGTKNKDWDDRDLKNNTRAAWELAANRALASAGRIERIDMRSFADRGIELQPQPKRYRSPSEAHLDGREHVLEQQVEAQIVARRNGERLLARPEIVLELLAAKQSVFTEHQVLRAIHRYTADQDQFERVRLAVFASAELVELSTDTGPRRFSTRATIATERSLLTNAHLLAQRASHQVAAAKVNGAIAASSRTLTDEQASAVRHLAASGDLAIIQGYAGSGKSTMLAAARAAWEAEGYTVVGGALAGKAAEGLADPSSAAIPSRTLAGWQWAWSHRRDLLTDKHVLVIDEAGMVGTSQLESILATARAAGAKVVLVGDTRQLQAIEPGAPMRILQQRYGAAKLSNVIRQGFAWQKEATRIFGDGNAEAAIRMYVEQGRTHRAPSAADAQRALIAQWAADRLERPTETRIVLAYRRKDVHALNELARAIRKDAGELGPDHVFETNQGVRAFAQGDRIYFLKNGRELGVTNGSLATIEAIEGSLFTVRLDDHRQLKFDARTYNALDHGYAATVHKSQGVTVDRAYVLASRYLDASATYVALSRHRQDAQLFYAETEFRDDAALIKKLSSQRSRAMALDAAGAVLPPPAKLDQALRAEQQFLALSPEAQLAELDKWKVAGSRATRSAAEVLELLPEVRAASAAQAQAGAQLALAARELQDFREQHPIAAELRTSAYRSREASYASAHQAMLAADRRLQALRADPTRRARAERIASRHNVAIKQARARWNWCRDLRQRQERDLALGRYAAAANQKRGDSAFRAAERADEGKTFEVLLKRQIGGEPVFILRSPTDGALVIADARLFPSEPALGTSAVLVGRTQSPEPRLEKGHSHDRSR